ncbi:PIN domain-containing protein [Prosthecobacter fusiformis]|uniref:PIN domain-containing protein n=1 Tax=Prosthecobacter fusiformis TaxID=48464 RepID=A0A4R7RIX7_9BACT|nr:type II toxin-antitoxin system VapC family toxin [Prosthecobacter fusiformis]TDU63221.1 PIN domain-containing protein [Prosthecobacter fusiformis]
MTSAYYDSTYLFKLQCQENGSFEVRAHAVTIDALYCSMHGRAEFVSACHRKVREGTATLIQLQTLLAQVSEDTKAGGLRWLPITEATISRVESVFSTASETTYLRAADAMHLACAAENGFSEIYSNDRHLLAAAHLFGLRGVNVIP